MYIQNKTTIENGENHMETNNGLLDQMKYNDYVKHNILYLDCEIDRNSQVMFCRQLEKLAKQELAKPIEERKPITVKISSYGGVVWDVFCMVSMMEYWQEQGITIKTVCMGYVASGGSKILMAGSKGHRYITRYARVLIHQSNSFKYGRSTLQEDIMETKYSLEDFELIKDMFRKHTKLSEQDLNDLLEKNVDVQYFADEAIIKGLADTII